MIRNINFVLYMMVGLVLLAFASCRKDLGNYVYEDVDSIRITGIENSYVITPGEQLNIVPQISFLERPFKEEDFEYEWISFNLAALPSSQRTDLHTNKNFDIPFPLGIGNYSMFFRVKDKVTGMSWQKKFAIQVVGTFKPGWAILSEVDSKARLSFYEYDKTDGTYPKFYQDLAGLMTDAATGDKLTLNGKPKFIQGWLNTTPASGNNKYLLYIGTDEMTTKINITDGFVWKDSYNFQFESASPSVLPRVDYIRPAGGGMGYAYYNGDVFSRYAVFQYSFGTPINRLASGNNAIFKVAPHIAVFPSSGYALMYDTNNKRFVRNSISSATATSPLPYNATTSAFDPNNVGKDLVWMGQTAIGGGDAYAVLKEDNKYYLARMDNAAAFAATFWDDISNLPELANAKFFAVDQQYGYLQYATSNKIYQYDVDTKQTKLMKDFGTREITVLKHNLGVGGPPASILTGNNPAQDYLRLRFVPVAYGLICATYDPSSPDDSAKVDVYKVPQFNAEFETYYSFDKPMGKIVDVTHVEHPQNP